MDTDHANDGVSNSLIEKKKRQGKKPFLIISHYLLTISFIHKPKVYLDTAKTGQESQ